MPKVDIEVVPSVLRDLVTTPPEPLDANTIVEFKKRLDKLAKEEKAERDANKGPKQKFQHVILVSDPNKVIPAGTELVGWVTKIKEEDDAGGILDRIFRAVRSFNLTKKGKKNPAKTVGEGLDGVTRKFFKEEGIQILTKEPVRIIFTDNAIPTEPTPVAV